VSRFNRKCPGHRAGLFVSERFILPVYFKSGGTLTREEFSELNNAEAKAYLLAELKSIVAAETAANKELQDQVGVLLPHITERLLKLFK
jgi:hypothetical protein